MSAPAITHPFRENGQKIRRARELVRSSRVAANHPANRPISQEDFASVLGISRRHIIRLENGEQRPSRELRDRIVEVTGTEEQIEADGYEDEEEALRALMERVQVPEHSMSIESRREWMYPNATQADVQQMRTRALREIKSSFELEATL